jgi:hypothetical protein
MKYALTCICAFTLLVSCENNVTKKPGTVEQTDNNLYFGKLILNDSTKTAMHSLVGYKTYTFDVLVGCECDDKVGDYTNKVNKTKEDKTPTEPTTKQMEIAGTVLELLQETGKEFLDHIYVKYRKSSITASTDNMMVVEFKIDLLDKTKLEKVTVYTSKIPASNTLNENKEYNTLVKQELEKPVIDTSVVNVDTNNIKKNADSIKQKKRIR